MDEDAKKAGIMRALETMRENMTKDNDLAVVHFSGHGTVIDGTLYLLPVDVDARDPVGIKTSALSLDQFKEELRYEHERHGWVRISLLHLLTC